MNSSQTSCFKKQQKWFQFLNSLVTYARKWKAINKLISFFNMTGPVICMNKYITKNGNLHYYKQSRLCIQCLISNSQLFLKINLKIYLVIYEQMLVVFLDWLFCKPAMSPKNWLVDFSSLFQLFDSGNPGFFAFLPASGLKATTLVSFSLTYFGRSPSVKWYNICSLKAGQA